MSLRTGYGPNWLPAADAARKPHHGGKDTTARTLLWVTLIIGVINMLMSGYVFLVVHHTVQALQQLGDAFNSVGQ